MKKQQDYELMSHSEIARMREDLSKLRGQVPTSAMSVSMEELSDSIQQMNKMFKAAIEGMQEENTSEDLKEQFKPMEEKLDAVIDQNHKIADAILTVVDLVNEFVADAKKQQESMRKMVNELRPQQPRPSSFPSSFPRMPSMPPPQEDKHDKTHESARHAPPPPPPRQPQMPPLKPLQQGMPPPSMPAPPKKKRSLFEAFK